MIQYLDILYKQIDGVDLYLDLYLPSSKEKTEFPSVPVKPPLILWIHGGAWMHGDRKSPHLLWQVNRGYALASIEYRLSCQAHFPAHIIDCKDALAYLKREADKYGYDANRIIAAGDSAGGHLAALMGTSIGQKDWEQPGLDYSVQAVVDYYGPITLRGEWPGILGADNGLKDPDSVQSQFLGADLFSKQGRARAAVADPTTYIDGGEPPFLILHGDGDDVVPYKQSVYLRNALERAGVPVSLYRSFGGGHSLSGHDVTSVVDAFLDYHF
ncbi:MAG: alpha/beta hydrolase [Defluviitaleaceae bacterium]|nr:alpha/beta hydrolase [Defluviitaleaceae bacterium]